MVTISSFVAEALVIAFFVDREGVLLFDLGAVFFWGTVGDLRKGLEPVSPLNSFSLRMGEWGGREWEIDQRMNQEFQLGDRPALAGSVGWAQFSVVETCHMLAAQALKNRLRKQKQLGKITGLRNLAG
ncbi:MAG: hypothetical protein IT425_02795 [Pirellulales bacterium]|nr:hypothetical protein [Pirellulales bacterium]